MHIACTHICLFKSQFQFSNNLVQIGRAQIKICIHDLLHTFTSMYKAIHNRYKKFLHCS